MHTISTIVVSPPTPAAIVTIKSKVKSTGLDVRVGGAGVTNSKVPGTVV